MRRGMSLIHLLLLMLLTADAQVALADAQALKPFTTDGCSLWIDGTPTRPNLWRGCCVAHDKAYWLGGSAVQRRQADDDLKACVTERAGKGMAEYMYVNVLWGGSPYWLTPYRWGYGWSYSEGIRPRGYALPTPDEQKQIDALLPLAEKIIREDELLHSS